VHRILALRHGETDWNREGRWQGWVDRPLLPEAVDQARERAEWIRSGGIAVAGVWASDLERARTTAAVIAEVLAVPLRVDAGLRERSGGEIEGLDRAGIEAHFPGFLRAWREGRLERPPGGESDGEVYERVVAVLDRVDREETPGTIVVVTHGGVLRILAQRGGAEPRGTPNLGGRWFDVADGRPVPRDFVEGLPAPAERAVPHVE
jgi:probable phosphoglycerate mutase